MTTIKGISNSFKIPISSINIENIAQIISLWYEELDKLYFSTQDLTIELNKMDLKIIKISQECEEKLKVLSYRKDIKIKNF